MMTKSIVEAERTVGLNQFKCNLDYQLIIEKGYLIIVDVDVLDLIETEFGKNELSANTSEEDYYSTLCTRVA